MLRFYDVARSFLARRRAHWHVTALAVAAVFCFLYVVARYPHTPALYGDTPTYLNMEWYRAPGLGLVTRVLHAITGTVYSVALVQLILGLGAAVFFPIALGNAIGSRTLALVLGVLLIFSSTARAADLALLSESQCLSFLLFALGFALRYWVRGRVADFACATAAVAGAMLFRPNAVMGLIPLALFWLARGHWSLRTVVTGAVPFLAIVGLWSATNYLRFGRATPFVRGGLVLFAATAQYYDKKMQKGDDPVIRRHKELVKFLSRSNQPLKKKLKDADKYPLVTAEARRQKAMIEVFHRRDDLGKGVAAYFAKERPRVCGSRWPKGSDLGPCMDREQAALARAAIRHHPVDYLKRVLTSATLYAWRTHDGLELGPRLYANNARAQRDRRWPGYRGAMMSVASKEYSVLRKPPTLLHFWKRVAGTPGPRIGWAGQRATLGRGLGLLDALLCVVVWVGFGARWAWGAVQRRSLRLPQRPAWVVCLALYGLYAGYHLSCAALHPALARYAGVMEPFTLAALFVLGLWLLRHTRPRIHALGQLLASRRRSSAASL